MQQEQTQHTSSDPRPPAPVSLIAWGSFFELLKTFGFVLILAFVIRQFLVQPFVVDGQSMEPNFHNQEYILVDKLRYRFQSPKRGEVIVFHPPHQAADNFIKRVIGLPGETVEIRGQRLFINQQEVTEPYLSTFQANFNTEETSLVRILGANEYFVLGDNRDHSKDSREIGPIPRDRLIGRAWLVLFPIDKLSVVATPLYSGLSKQPEPVLVYQPGHS